MTSTALQRSSVDPGAHTNSVVVVTGGRVLRRGGAVVGCRVGTGCRVAGAEVDGRVGRVLLWGTSVV